VIFLDNRSLVGENVCQPHLSPKSWSESMSRLAKMMAKACAIAGLLLVLSHTLAPAAETSIEDGFKNPPDSA
jgi:hypothetical protein